jgi:hypothetical protein
VTGTRDGKDYWTVVDKDSTHMRNIVYFRGKWYVTVVDVEDIDAGAPFRLVNRVVSRELCPPRYGTALFYLNFEL